MSTVETRKTPSQINCLVVIPHYNHTATLRQVAEQCRAVWPYVLVVDDGSAYFSPELLAGLDVAFIRQSENRGKGTAILAGAAYARAHGFTHVITIDADAQHNPAEITAFVQKATQCPHALIIGVRQFAADVPFSSRFGRKFGNFWVRVQTGKAVQDIQSGYRCYPAAVLEVLNVWSKRYAFEVEVVVRALWAGFSVEEIPVSVVYGQKRISHFSRLKDNVRLTILNTYLTMRALVPLAHRHYEWKDGKIVAQRYGQTLKNNLAAPGSAWRNARSAAWGIFCGSIALPGIRQVWLFGGMGWWDLNRLVSVGCEKLCIGPFVPALCIEVGYFLRHGEFLTDFNMTTLGKQAAQRVWEWFLGSLAVAPCLALLAGALVGVAGWLLQRRFHERV